MTQDGVGHFTKTKYKNIFLDIPELKQQEEELTYLRKMKELEVKLNSKHEHINKLLKKGLLINSEREIHVADILDYISRNDCLSEEGLYQRISNVKSPLSVLSGSDPKNVFGYLDLEKAKEEGLHILENKPGLHLITRGDSGKLTFLKTGCYTGNTNCYILFLKPEAIDRFELNTIEQQESFLRLLKILISPKFESLGSNSDVSVFPTTQVFNKSISITIPEVSLNSEILKILSYYDKLEFYKNQIECVVKKLKYFSTSK